MHQQATAWILAAMKLMAMVDVRGSHLTMKSDVSVAAAAGTPNRAKHARRSYLVYAPLRLSLRAPAERRGEGAGEDENGNSQSGNDCVFAHVGNASKYCWVKKKMGSRGRWSETDFSQPTRRQCQSAFKKQGGEERPESWSGRLHKSYVANNTQQRACLCLCVCRCDDAWQ